MKNTLLLYPVTLMFILTLFIYVKNYFNFIKAKKNNVIKFNYFKNYKGEVPDYLDVSRQTLKNQFELPIFFYFLTSVVIFFNQVDKIDLICAWVFTITRYIHCYIRLTSNHVPYRAKVFKLGMLILVVWWFLFLYKVM
tara:strand:- start:172 stop:585 length:414 start_codon:yes stop_codon:yes gene_type:complete